MNIKLYWLITMLVMGLMTAKAAVIFDSVADFSGTQGQDNWYYGYYDGDSASPFTSSDFEELPQFINDTIWLINREDPSGYWTSLYATGGHPNGPVGNYFQGTEHWAVRRWISDVTGTLQIEGALAKLNTTGGDGIIGHVFINGDALFSQRIYAHDGTGVNYSIQTEVNVGDIIDFAIQPVANDLYDSTGFTATGTVIPEPVNVALLSSLLPLMIIRRKFAY